MVVIIWVQTFRIENIFYEWSVVFDVFAEINATQMVASNNGSRLSELIKVLTVF